MSNFQPGDQEDFYHDDPELLIPSRRQRRSTSLLTALLLLVGGGFFHQSTLAANLNVNGGSGVEFGQGISQTVSCVGVSENIVVTPYSLFLNTSGSVGHYLDTITVSSIPTTCRGVDFVIKAYNDGDSTPLALFDTNVTAAIVETIDTPGTSNDSATAWAGAAGISVSANATGTSFTINFTNPVARSSDVYKITIESSNQYSIGGTGQAGGILFYASTTGFSCGPTFTAKCKYLEAAPNTWSGGANDPTVYWAATSLRSSGVLGIDRLGSGEQSIVNNSSRIGRGFVNTQLIVTQNGSCATPLVVATCSNAAGATRAYSKNYLGSAYSDWYLPDASELNQLCKYAKGLPWTSDATVCTTSTSVLPKGFQSNYYSASLESSDSQMWVHNFANAGQSYLGGKASAYCVRPIRSF